MAWRWDVSPLAPQKEKDSVWMAYVTMDPGDAKTVFTGTKRVWRTKDAGKKWKAMSPVLDGSTISAIEVARSDSRRVYVGTKNGGFFRSVDGGKTWSANLCSAALPGHEITRIDSTKELGSDFVLVTLANFGHSHLFRSQNGGKTWEDIEGPAAGCASPCGQNPGWTRRGRCMWQMMPAYLFRTTQVEPG